MSVQACADLILFSPPKSKTTEKSGISWVKVVRTVQYSDHHERVRLRVPKGLDLGCASQKLDQWYLKRSGASGVITRRLRHQALVTER